jgi:hypothetical protein
MTFNKFYTSKAQGCLSQTAKPMQSRKPQQTGAHDEMALAPALYCCFMLDWT